MLSKMKIEEFIKDLASSKATPGGGVVAALNLTLAASLLEMVIHLSIKKKEFADHKSELQEFLDKLGEIREAGIELMAEDETAFKSLMEEYRKKNVSKFELDDKLKKAIEPGEKIIVHCESMVLMARKMTHITNKNVASDIEVAVANILAATSSALSNIFINARSLSDKQESSRILNTNLEKKIFIYEACEIVFQDTE